MPKKNDKRGARDGGDIRCPKCGRQKSIRKMELRLYRCEHCNLMFEEGD